MPTYYDVTVNANLPAADEIVGRPCTIVFSYPEGSFSHPYNGTVTARTGNTSLRMSSAVLNIEAAWVGANGGTLTITLAGAGAAAGQDYGVTGFAKVAQEKPAAVD